MTYVISYILSLLLFQQYFTAHKTDTIHDPEQGTNVLKVYCDFDTDCLSATAADVSRLDRVLYQFYVQ